MGQKQKPSKKHAVSTLTHSNSQRTCWTKTWGHCCRHIACLSLWDIYRGVQTSINRFTLPQVHQAWNWFYNGYCYNRKGWARPGYNNVYSVYSFPYNHFLKQKISSLKRGVYCAAVKYYAGNLRMAFRAITMQTGCNSNLYVVCSVALYQETFTKGQMTINLHQKETLWYKMRSSFHLCMLTCTNGNWWSVPSDKLSGTLHNKPVVTG